MLNTAQWSIPDSPKYSLFACSAFNKILKAQDHLNKSLLLSQRQEMTLEVIMFFLRTFLKLSILEKLWRCINVHFNAPDLQNAKTSVVVHSCWWSVNEVHFISHTWLLHTLLVPMEATSVALVFHRTAWKAVCSSHGCIHYIKNRSCTAGSQYSQ